MLSEERRRRILQHVHVHGSAQISTLSDQLGVSEATVRRDLDALADDSLLRRVRGGACDVRTSVRPEADSQPFTDVATVDSAAKDAIGRLAAGLVDDGDVIALDIGTTVAAMCPHLARRSLTVVTASLAVIRALENARHVDVIVLGGLLRPNYQSMVGTLTEHALRQIRVDKAFIGTAGVHPDGSVLDSTPSEVPVKRAMLSSTDHAWLLADAKKFPGSGFLRVCHLSDLTGLITDRAPEHLPEDAELEVHLT